MTTTVGFGFEKVLGAELVGPTPNSGFLKSIRENEGINWFQTGHAVAGLKQLPNPAEATVE
ncbi:MAG: hypothetical protein FJW36_06145 [Acidobacteria bacterium]|nr:hypothetical protein [Acidobacteriota bacterium]